MTTSRFFNVCFVEDKEQYGNPADSRLTADSVKDLPIWQDAVEKAAARVQAPKATKATRTQALRLTVPASPAPSTTVVDDGEVS
jgi:hypothetical protein